MSESTGEEGNRPEQASAVKEWLQLKEELALFELGNVQGALEANANKIDEPHKVRRVLYVFTHHRKVIREWAHKDAGLSDAVILPAVTFQGAQLMASLERIDSDITLIRPKRREQEVTAYCATATQLGGLEFGIQKRTVRPDRGGFFTVDKKIALQLTISSLEIYGSWILMQHGNELVRQ